MINRGMITAAEIGAESAMSHSSTRSEASPRESAFAQIMTMGGDDFIRTLRVRAFGLGTRGLQTAWEVLFCFGSEFARYEDAVVLDDNKRTPARRRVEEAADLAAKAMLQLLPSVWSGRITSLDHPDLVTALGETLVRATPFLRQPPRLPGSVQR